MKGIETDDSDLTREEEKRLIAEDERDGEKKDWDQIWSDLDYIREKIDQNKRAIGFVADCVQDEQASANLSLIELGLERLVNYLDKTIDRVPTYKDDVPY